MAIAHQATAGQVGSSQTTTITITNVVVDSGTDRILIVRVSGEGEITGPPTVTAVARDGQSGVFLGRAHGTSWSWAEIWKIVAPNVGTATLTVSLDKGDGGAGIDGAMARADVYTGVDQTTPNRTPASTTSTGTTGTVTVTGASAGDLLLDVIDVDGGGKTLTVGAGQTSDYNDSGIIGGTDTYGSTQDGSSGGVMSWTWSGSAPWSQVAIALIPSSGGGSTPVSREWSVLYDIINSLSRTWAVTYDMLNQLSREWAVTYDLIGSVSQITAVTYDISNPLSQTWEVTYDVGAGLSREWAVTYDLIEPLSRTWAITYDVGDVVVVLVVQLIGASSANLQQMNVYSVGRRR